MFDARIVLGMVSTVGTLFAFALTSALSPHLQRQHRPVTPQDRIKTLRNNLAETGRLLRELEDELDERTRVLEELAQKSEQYERLASLNQDQAKAIEALVGREFQKQARLSWWQWGLSLLSAFVLGIGASLLTPAVAHLFH